MSILDQMEQMSDEDFRDVMLSACFRRSQTTKGSEATAQVVIECLHDLCNGSGFATGRAWWKQWVKTHPTIRQTVVRTFYGLMQTWVREWKKGNVSPDGRDTASYEFAQRCVADDFNFPIV